jgi:ABC-2 type transport system permease protein
MLQRLGAIIQKEFIQVLRDRATMAIMLTTPLIQLILFGYAISMNVRHIPLLVADQSKDPASRSFVQALVNSSYFDLAGTVDDQNEAIHLIDLGQAQAAVVIPPGFGEDVQRGDAQALILVDGSDLFTSQSAYNYSNIIGQSYAATIVMQDAARAGLSSGSQVPQALNPHIRILYNPDMLDLWFIIPGMAAMLLQTQTIVLTAAAVVREREVGTIEQILVTPIRPIELMVGKVVPYLAIAIINMLTVLGIGMYWFGVPFQGSFWLFMALSFIYVFSGLGLGLLISTVSQNQRQAQQLIMLIMMVSLVLGGFLFPRYMMPAAIRYVGNLFPLTYFIPIARGIISKGNSFPLVATEVGALAIYVVVVMFLTARTFRQRLE